jgi:hypothetical protein
MFPISAITWHKVAEDGAGDGPIEARLGGTDRSGRRHRQRSTILVSNLPFKQWAELLPSPGLAVTIVNRLLDDATA